MQVVPMDQVSGTSGRWGKCLLLSLILIPTLNQCPVAWCSCDGLSMQSAEIKSNTRRPHFLVMRWLKKTRDKLFLNLGKTGWWQRCASEDLETSRGVLQGGGAFSSVEVSGWERIAHTVPYQHNVCFHSRAFHSIFHLIFIFIREHGAGAQPPTCDGCITIIVRATIDLEPKIRTAEENLILSPKMKQLFLFAHLTSDHMLAYLSL